MDQLWRGYVEAAHLHDATFKAYVLADSPELADELLALVLAGTMRATTKLARDFGGPHEPLPKTGDLSILLDGRNTPRCITKTLEVQVKPIREVDERFARDEGGGDRSLQWWMSARTRYFKRQGMRAGFSVDANTEVVLERFEVVWPPEFADRKGYGAA